MFSRTNSQWSHVRNSVIGITYGGINAQWHKEQELTGILPCLSPTGISTSAHPLSPML